MKTKKIDWEFVIPIGLYLFLYAFVIYGLVYWVYPLGKIANEAFEAGEWDKSTAHLLRAFITAIAFIAPVFSLSSRTTRT